jgi:hypothetical protein
MLTTLNRRTLVIALTAVLAGVGLLARPFGIAGLAQSNQQATDGARLMRGAVQEFTGNSGTVSVKTHTSQSRWSFSTALANRVVVQE